MLLFSHLSSLPAASTQKEQLLLAPGDSADEAKTQRPEGSEAAQSHPSCMALHGWNQHLQHWADKQQGIPDPTFGRNK